MKKIVFLFILLSGIVNTISAQQVKNIGVKEFKELIEKTGNKVVLDVRTDSEVAQGIIPNAIQIDYNSKNFDANLDKLDKNKPVFVYCAVGGRSGKTAKVLANKGFKTIYNLDGGITAWRATGLQTIIPKK